MSDVNLRNEEGRVDRHEEGRYNEDLFLFCTCFCFSLRSLLLL